MAWDTRNGLRVRRKSSSPLVTGSVSRNSKRPKKNNTVAVAPTAQRQVISAKVSNGRRKAARKPSDVGEMGMCRQGYRGFVQRIFGNTTASQAGRDPSTAWRLGVPRSNHSAQDDRNRKIYLTTRFTILPGT